jgi:hypothetical protein
MAEKKKRDRDGICIRKGSYYISFSDAAGRRVQRQLKGVVSLTKARELRNAELARVEKARTLGYAEPTKDTFAEIIPRYLSTRRRDSLTSLTSVPGASLKNI